MDTLEITVQRKSLEGWPVVAEDRPSSLFLPVRREGVLQLDLVELRGQTTPEEYGKLLGKALFHDELRDALTEAKTKGDGLVRVLLFVEAPDLKALRWEQLCAPIDGNWVFLALDQRTPLTLHLPSVTARDFPPIGRRDLRALVLATSPDGLQKYELSPFDVAAAITSVRAALGGIPCDVLAPVEDARGPPTLDALCERITAEKYTLLHLVCHGRFKRDDNETVLYLAKADGQVDPVDATRFLQRLERVGAAHGLPYFAFLASCESASPEAEGALGGLAQRLVRELGMPAVVAMTGKVSVATAQRLAEGFYPRLREHGEVDRALVEATAGLVERGDINVPALYSRLGGLPLFSDTLTRPLTNSEIKHGLDLEEQYLDQRAPVLRPEFDASAATLRGMLNTEPAALSISARREREKALEQVNILCGEALDLSFNALALEHPPPTVQDARCPFRGLSPFKIEDHEFFFGRETLVKDLQQRLEEFHFLAVLGDSGSGKSSLVLAGLVPALLAKQPAFEPAVLTPGNDPIGALAACLAKIDGQAAVLVVDQFEEVFALCADEANRRAFLEQLLSLPHDLRVITTMRADFLGECARYDQLKRTMQAHNELIAPMGTAELRRAMEMQAEKVGLRFEADLSATIIDDVHGEPGAMPLLQHALLELWKRRHGRWLRADEYRAIGRVQQAIARTADATYENLSRDQQNQVRNIFVRLTRLDEDVLAGEERRDVRRRVCFEDLVSPGNDPDVTKALVERLAISRLVVIKRNTVSDRNEVEVAHEALIRHWPRLRNWLDDDREFLLWRQRLRTAVNLWEGAVRDRGHLLHGALLKEARRWLRRRKDDLLPSEREYILTSVARRWRNWKWWGLAVTIALVVVLNAIWYAQIVSNQALQDARKSLYRQLAADVLSKLNHQFDLALLLSIEAGHVSPTVEAKHSLLTALQHEPRLFTFLWSHDAGVQSVAFSPDGKTLASGSIDRTVILWDVASRRPLGVPLNGHKNHVTSVAFSPDGKTLASGSIDQTVILWDVASRQRVRELVGHSGRLFSVAFSPDGKTLASGSEDGTIVLWDATRGRSLGAPISGHKNRVTSVAFSPDGKTLASGSGDKTIILWDVASRKPLGVPLTGNDGWVTSVAFSPGGTMLASGSGNRTILLWDVASRTQISEPLVGHSDALFSVAFSPDGRTLASGSKDRTIILWDVASRKQISEPMVGHSESLFSIAFSPDGKTLASGSDDARIILWDVASRSRLAQRLTGPQAAVISVAFRPDSDTLTSWSSDGACITWDVVSGKYVSKSFIRHAGSVSSAAFSPDGKMLALGSDDTTTSIWLVESGTTLGTPLSGHEGKVSSVAFSQDSKMLATASDDGTAIVWDVASRSSQLGFFGFQSAPILSVTFSANGEDLFIGDRAGAVSSWVYKEVVPSGYPWINHRSGVSAIASSLHRWSPASGDLNGIVWLRGDKHKLDRKSRTLIGHKGAVSSMAFSPDGTILASGSGDRSVILWDAESGRLLGAPLTDHRGGVTSVAFSPNGKRLASGSEDRTIVLWDTDLDSWRRLACRIANRNLSRSEWSEFLGDEPYRKTCSGLP